MKHMIDTELCKLKLWYREDHVCMLEIDYLEYAILFRIEYICLIWKMVNILTAIYVPNKK